MKSREDLRRILVMIEEKIQENSEVIAAISVEDGDEVEREFPQTAAALKLILKGSIDLMKATDRVAPKELQN